MAEENKLSFKYSEGKGTAAPTNADENALYLTNGRLYKGNVLIADKSPDTYSWDKITAKPTSLAGYGIVDGATQSGYYPNMHVGKAISDENGRNIADKYFRYRDVITNNTNADNLTQFGLWVNTTGNGTGNSNFPNTYGTFISFPSGRNYGGVQINVTNKNITKIRNYWGNTWTDWEQLAKITDTVASADKLATPRTIWGQSFNGTENVTGDFTTDGYSTFLNTIYAKKYGGQDDKSTASIVINKGGDWVGIGPSSFNIRLLSFGTTSNSHGTWKKEIMSFSDDGNVGIGVSSIPAYTLDVAGTGRFTGDVNVPTINGGTPITSSNIASQSVAQANTANSVAWSGVTGKPTTLAGYGITDAISTSNIGSQTVAQALELTDANGNVSFTADDIQAIDNKFANYSPIKGSPSLTKYSGGNFGNAAAKNYTTSVQSGNGNLVTSGAVYTAIDNLRQEVRVAFPSMATLSAYSLNGSTLNCYIESEDNIDLWSDLSAGAVLFVVIQDGASVEGTFNIISAKYDGSSDTTEIAVRQSPGLYSGYGCVLVSTGSLDTNQGGISIVYPIAAS